MTIELTRRVTRPRTRRLDVTRFLPSFVLAGYGLFVISLFLRGVMTWYINPNYVAPTVLAGAVLIGLAAVGLGRKAQIGCADGCCAGDCCGEAPTRWRTYAVLAVPLVLAALFPPRGLAAFSAIQRGPQIAGLSPVRGATVSRVSLSVDTRSFSMTDWVGALAADPNPRDYAGKPVIVTGLVLRNTGMSPPGYFMVLRYLVTCCIADARPVGLIVKDTSHGALKDNQWVRVTGVMGAAHYQGQALPVVEPKQLTPIKSQDPYIY